VSRQFIKAADRNSVGEQRSGNIRGHRWAPVLS
jgi:hypothetical protein